MKSSCYGTLRRQLLQMHGDLLLGRISTEIVAQSLGATPSTDLTPCSGSEEHRSGATCAAEL